MKTLIIANWKMNPETLAKAKRLFNSIKIGIKNIKNTEVMICPPFIYLQILKSQDPSFAISFGGQNCFWENPPTGGGAFTGEISAKMLKNLGCKYIILGHSERRVLGETDEMINKKVKTALKQKLKVILCVGDKNRRSKEDIKEVLSQLRNCLKGD